MDCHSEAQCRRHAFESEAMTPPHQWELPWVEGHRLGCQCHRCVNLATRNRLRMETEQDGIGDPFEMIESVEPYNPRKSDRVHTDADELLDASE